MVQSKKLEFHGTYTLSDARQLGLCLTCNHIDTCTGRKTWLGPVTFCEEFDDFLPAPKRPGPIGDAVGGLMEARAETEEFLRGLCVNCDLRQTCRLPKTEGGIWHCEEYR